MSLVGPKKPQEECIMQEAPYVKKKSGYSPPVGMDTSSQELFFLHSNQNTTAKQKDHPASPSESRKKKKHRAR